MPGQRHRHRARMAIAIVGALATACGGSMLPTIVDGLPPEVGGEARQDRPVAAGALGAALEDAGVPADAVAAHEVRWGDDTRLVILEFENIGLDEASRVSRGILGIGDVESQLAFVGNQTPFQLTGLGIPGVAFQIVPAGRSAKSTMYTILAPTEVEAATILAAIGERYPGDP